MFVARFRDLSPILTQETGFETAVPSIHVDRRGLVNEMDDIIFMVTKMRSIHGLVRSTTEEVVQFHPSAGPMAVFIPAAGPGHRSRMV